MFSTQDLWPDRLRKVTPGDSLYIIDAYFVLMQTTFSMIDMHLDVDIHFTISDLRQFPFSCPSMKQTNSKEPLSKLELLFEYWCIWSYIFATITPLCIELVVNLVGFSLCRSSYVDAVQWSKTAFAPDQVLSGGKLESLVSQISTEWHEYFIKTR